MILLRAGIVLGLAAAAGCGKAPAPAQRVAAESVQGNDTAFTTLRPLSAQDAGPPDIVVRPVDTAPPVPAEGYTRLRITYFGSPATVTLQMADDRELRDTTAPRDAGCDGFDGSHSGDVGCRSENRTLEVRSVPAGDAYLEFAAKDPGTIWFSVEAVARDPEQNRYRPGLEFRVHAGDTVQFHLSLPLSNSRDSLRVDPVSGPIDSVPPPPPPR